MRGPAGDADGSRDPTADDVPLRIRVFVTAFLAAFVVCGVAGIEAWPLSGFRLFSHVRTEHRTSWVAVTVDAAGVETPIPFGRLPAAYRGFGLIAPDLRSMPGPARLAACDAWVRIARSRLDRVVDLVRIYRLDLTMVPRAGDRPAATPARTLVLSCPGLGGDSDGRA